MEGSSTAYKLARKRIKYITRWSYFPRRLGEYFAAEEVHLDALHWKFATLFYIHDSASSTKSEIEVRCKS